MKNEEQTRTISLGGLAFSVGPVSRLSAAEADFLTTSDSHEPSFGSPIRIDIAVDPPFSYSGAPEGSDAADVQCIDGRVHVRHATFGASISPATSEATVHRTVDASGPLYVTIKTAMACRLPLERGLILHSAGVVIDGRAYVFFGRSGAGKSTLSGLSPYPLLSDEHVVITVDPAPAARASGSWGEFTGTPIAGSFPLGALVEIGRGPEFKVTRMNQSQAMRALTGVAQIQPLKELWTPALAIISSLISQIPVYHMEWRPEAEVWSEIKRALVASQS
jgi:hypothetical protein